MTASSATPALADAPANPRARFTTDSGALVLIEESHALPIVQFSVALRTGGQHDPERLEGLTRATARVVRMGAGGQEPNEVEELIDSLGGQLSIETATSYVRFEGSVIKRNVGPMMRLVGALLSRPALRDNDVEQAKRETLADIIESRDNDRGLASLHYRRALFPNHPYGRSVIGRPSTVAAITRADIQRHFETHYVASNMILGFAGDVSEAEVRELVGATFADLRRGPAPTEVTQDPAPPTGRRVVLIDKPERTQTQIMIGTLGTHPRDEDHIPLLVANTVLGGTFTARLMREVRSVRGWSYGASSRLGSDRRREAFTMWTFPASRDAVACVALELELLEAWVREGITADELTFAQSYLANSYAFDIDTASERLDQRIDTELLGLPSDYFDSYVARIRAVTLAEANAAIRNRIHPENLVIALVATSAELRDGLAALPNVSELIGVPFDSD